MLLTNLESKIEGFAWPAIPSPLGALSLAVLFQLEKTQWWAPEVMRKYQFQQLAQVFVHACKTIPFYRDRFADAGVDPASITTFKQLRQIPLLTRRELQDMDKALLSNTIPKSHGRTFTISTSGSTGRPVNVATTDIDTLFWNICTLRDHVWQERDLSRKLVAVRFLKDNKAMFPEGINANIWGVPERDVFMTGPAALLNIKSTISQQTEWLCRQNPHYLMSYPSNILALAEHFMSAGRNLPNLLEVRTVGESLGPDVRLACRKAWNVPVVDMYSCQEVSCIALQCPDHELYHIQSERLMVEILNDQDEPCGPGEIGRIVISTLHNFAMPLIRYELDDYAEVGKPCACGRGLPVLNRILGRQRNMLMLPNGEKLWPVLPLSTLAQDFPVKQFQFIQKNLESIEVRLVAGRPLDEKEEQQFAGVLHDRFSHPFQISFSYLDAIPRSESGKYEEFISEVRNPDRD